MSGLDLSTKAGVLRFCELRRAEMVRCFERLGRFESNGYSFCAYVFATHAVHTPKDPGATPDAWKTGRKLDRVEVLVCRMPEALGFLVPAEHQTEIFSRTMRLYAKLTRAIGTVVMSEAWHVETATREERYELPASLEDYDHPSRGEALCLQLEHSAAGRRYWVAEIRRDPTRLEPWVDRTPTDAEGRLVDLAEWRS